MLSFLKIPPETIAFWLGFLAATVFWWLAGRVRAQMPRITEAVRLQIRASRRKSQEKADEYLRRETLRRAQAMHLAAPLFSLDEVLVPPMLIAPPQAFLKEGAGAPDTMTGQIVPYLPDWPQLASPYPVEKLTLAEAIHNGVRVAIIGQPGSGKTVALAALASQMARKDASLGAAAEWVPLLLHVLDLPPETGGEEPLEVLIRAAAGKFPALMQRQIPPLLRGAAQDGRLVLLLDGVDELPHEQVKKVAAFLETLFEKAPGIRALLAVEPDDLDGLTGIGFLPLALAGWKQTQVRDFVKRWGELWTARITPEIRKQDPEAVVVDPRLLDSWLLSDWGILTPLEATLRVWGAYAGDLNGPDLLEAGEAIVRRLTRGAIPEEALAALAAEFLKQGQAGLTFSQLEQVLRHFKISEGQPEPVAARAGRQPPGRGGKTVTSGGQILDQLLQSGLLVEHPGEVLRLVSPELTGLMASWTGSENQINLSGPVWSAAASTAKYLAARGQGQALVQGLLDGREDPLYSRLLLAAGWLAAAPLSAEWRPAVMRRMLNLIQQESVPVNVRARLAAAFACSNDPSNALLFKQLLGSPSAALRRLAALASGLVRSPKLSGDLTALLGDPVPDVRAAACLALSAYGGKTAANILPEALMHGEESLQLAAAEALAGDEAGQEILRGALETDNLMVRRAAVLALAHVRAPWALQRLEKVAVEDAQWVVRSAAAQAVENLQKPEAIFPAPRPQPSEAGWLIAFAGKQGVGVIPGQVPVDLLEAAAQQGSLEEKLAALVYLKDYPSQAAVTAVQQAACAEQPLLRDAGQYVLWYLHASGVELPASGGY